MPYLLLFFLSAFLFSCVSTYTALQGIEHGLTKQTVWNTAGKPLKVGRYDGLDRWTYHFRHDRQYYTQDIFFDEGKVVKKGPLRPYPDYEKQMLTADSLEEYEINATLYHQQKEAGFREINSVKPRKKSHKKSHNRSNKKTTFCTRHFAGPLVKTCDQIVSGSTFFYPALLFCVNNIKKPRLKLKALSFIANKKFQPEALRFCQNNLSKPFSKVTCLSLVANKKIKATIFRNCKARAKGDTKRLNCLKNANYSLLAYAM